MARSGRNSVRDTAILSVCALIAVIFASAVLGGPRPALPSAAAAALAEAGVATMLALAMAPVAVLAVVTLVSIRIIRRHNYAPRVPYGLAISAAGLWVAGAGLMAGLPAPVSG